MALIVSYVNPDSTGGDGTTSATSGANAAYASLGAWNTARANNLVSNGNSHEVHCSGTTTADTTAVTLNGWTTDATHTLSIISDDNHGIVFPSSGYRMQVSSGTACIQNYATHVKFIGLALNNNGATYGILNRSTGTVGYEVQNCIFKGNGGTTEHYGHSIISAAGGTLKMWNNLAYSFGTNTNASAYLFNIAGVTSYVYNCLAAKSRKGFKQLAGTVVLKNCIYQALGASTPDGYNGTFDAASNYNISSEAADAPGANSKDSTTVSFTNTGTDDYHLVEGDTAAKGAGVDLSADANLAFSTDIEGDPRVAPWDIGPDAFIIAFGIDSEPVTMARGETGLEFVVSNPATTPTTENTTVVSGSASLTVIGVSGAGPYTITCTCPSNIALQHSDTGYIWTVTVGAESDTTALIPLTVPSGYSNVFMGATISLEEGSGSVWNDYTGDTPVEGTEFVWTTLTVPDSYPIDVQDTGEWSIDTSLLGYPTANQTFYGYAIQANGTIGTTAEYTFNITIPGEGTWSGWLATLVGNSTTEKLLLFLASKGYGGGMTNAMYEYLKSISAKNSHSERYQEWKDGGFN